MLKNEVWKIRKTFLVIFMFCVIYFVCFYNQIDFKKNINFSLSDSGIYNSSNCTIEDAIKKVDIQQISLLVDEKLKKIKNQKTILEWTDPVYDTEILKELPTYCGKCKLSLDRKKEKEADAILFEFNKIHPIPESRSPEQIYVFNAVESTSSIKMRNIDYKKYDNFFNLTMSYRRDSDIIQPQNKHFELPTTTMETLTSFFQNKYKNVKDAGIGQLMNKKSKLMVWLVSNCGSNPGARARLKLGEMIAKSKIGARFDRFGQCFGTKISEKDKYKDKKTFQKISGYKFYFAAENSYHCRDYITEKLYRKSFKMEIVPVVWGSKKSDYLKVIPKGSAIFVEDFKSVEDLVDYIDYLDRNKTAYLEYFEWRKANVTEMRGYRQRYGLCQLCRQLNGINVDYLYYGKHVDRFKHFPLFDFVKPRIVKSVHELLYDTENPECLNDNHEHFFRKKRHFEQRL